MLSIIIPVYNVENYIKDCLNAIDFKSIDIEVIIVNDGTKDSSFKIAQEYSGFSNVKLVEKVNGGLSSARNYGLIFATGKYVYFYDSDDVVIFDNLMKIYKYALDNDLEIVYGDYQKFFDNDNLNTKKSKKIDDSKNEVHIYSRQEYYKKYMKSGSIDVSVWRGVYKIDYLKKNGIGFIEGLIYEDVLFSFSLLLQINKIVKFDSVIYYYRQRENSLMKQNSEKHVNSKFFIAKKLHELYIKHDNYEAYLYGRNLYFSTVRDSRTRTKELTRYYFNLKYITIGYLIRFFYTIPYYVLSKSITVDDSYEK